MSAAARAVGTTWMLAIVSALILLTGTAQAASPGAFDPSFGSGGVVAAGGALFGVAVQSDGSVVAAGQSGGRVLVVRYSASGAATGSYLGPSGVARAVAIEPDGKIVVAGSTGGAMLVERLTASLAPDTSFGSGGAVVALGGSGAIANAVAVGSDGSIAAGGSVGGPDTSLAMARFTSSGAQSFAETFGFGGYAVARGVAVQSDGNIVFVGSQTPSQVTNGLIGRLTPTGAMDSSFAGGAGVFTFHYPGGGYTSLNAVTLQNDGSIVAAGVDAGGPNAVVIRVTPAGGLDSSFGAGGATAQLSGVNINVPGDPIGAYGVGIAGGGRIIAAGNFENGGTQVDQALWGFTASGATESTFGAGGTVRGPTGGYEACALAVAPDGSLVTAGNSVTSYPHTNPCATGSSGGFIARYIGYGPAPAGRAPTALTGAASAVGKTSATVAGAVNPDGLATAYRFQYGSTAAYGSITAAVSVGAGSAATSVSAGLSGLQPGTTYHYRLLAGNASGAGVGADRTFKTAAATAPSVTTGAARNVEEVAATLGGQVNPNGLRTSYHVQYGRSTKYGASTQTGAVLGESGVGVSFTVGKLRPGTTYHYRLVASNGIGSDKGADRTFRTAGRIHVSVRGVAPTYKIAFVVSHGLSLTIKTTQASRTRGSLVILAATSKRLGLGKRAIVIGSGVLRLRHRGSGKLHLVLSSSGARLLARLGSVGVAVVTKTTPAGGGPSPKSSASVTLRR